jgi:hypothetical protein
LRPALFLEAGTAKHRPALGGFEGDCGFSAALGARSTRLRPHTLRSARALGLALLAMLGVVLELFIVKEDLLARGKHKFGATIGALQYSIGEFHGRLPQIREVRRNRPWLRRDVPVAVPCLLSECTTRARTAFKKKSGIRTLSGDTGKMHAAMNQWIRGCSA